LSGITFTEGWSGLVCEVVSERRLSPCEILFARACAMLDAAVLDDPDGASVVSGLSQIESGRFERVRHRLHILARSSSVVKFFPAICITCKLPLAASRSRLRPDIEPSGKYMRAAMSRRSGVLGDTLSNSGIGRLQRMTD
jgi:hypothetical protein